MAIYQITDVLFNSAWESSSPKYSILGLVFATDKKSIIVSDVTEGTFIQNVIPLNCANYMPISSRITVNKVIIRRLFK